MTLTKRTSDAKGKTQLKEKKKKLKNKSRCGVYEALRRERFNEQLKKLQDVLAPEVVVKTKVEIVIAAQLFVRRCKSLHSPKGLSVSGNETFDGRHEDVGPKPIKEAGTHAAECNIVQGNALNFGSVPPTNVHSVENTYPLVELDQNCRINLNEVVGVTVLNNANNLLPVQQNSKNSVPNVQNNKPISCLQLVNNSSIGNEANQFGSKASPYSVSALPPDAGQTCTLLSPAKPAIETQVNVAHKNLVPPVQSEPIRIVLKEPVISNLSVYENQGMLVETSRSKSPEKVARALAPSIRSGAVISCSNTKPLLTPRLVGTVQNNNVLSLVTSTRAPGARESQPKRSPRRLMKKPLNPSVNPKNLQLILSPNNNSAISTSQKATSSTVAKIVHKCSPQVKLLAPRKAPESQSIVAFEPVHVVPNVRPEAPIVVLCPSIKPPPKLRNIAPKQSPSASQPGDLSEIKNSNQMMPLITREDLLAEKKRTSCLAPSFRPEKRLKLSSHVVGKNDSTKDSDLFAGSKKSLPKSKVAMTPSCSSPSIVSEPSGEMTSIDGCDASVTGMSTSSLETNTSVVTSTLPASQGSLRSKADRCQSVPVLNHEKSATSMSSITDTIAPSMASESNSSEPDKPVSHCEFVSRSVTTLSSTVTSSSSITEKVAHASRESCLVSPCMSSTNAILPEASVVTSNVDHLCTNNYTGSSNLNDNKIISLKPDDGCELPVSDANMQARGKPTLSTAPPTPKASPPPVSSGNQLSSGLEIYSEISIPTVTRDLLFSDRKCHLLPETYPVLLPTSCHTTPVASIISSDSSNSSHSSSHCPSKTGSPGCAIITSTAASLCAAPKSANASCRAGIDFDHKVCTFVCTSESLSGHPGHQPVENKLFSSTTASAGMPLVPVASTTVISSADSLGTHDHLPSCHSVSGSSTLGAASQSKGNAHSVQSIFSSASSSSNYSITALCMSSKGKAMTNSNVRDGDKPTMPLNTSKFSTGSAAYNSFTTELTGLKDHAQTTSTPLSKVHEPCASVQVLTTSEGTSHKLNVQPRGNQYNSVLTSIQSKVTAPVCQKNTVTAICSDKNVYGTVGLIPQLKLNAVDTLNDPVRKTSSINSSVPPTSVTFTTGSSNPSVFSSPNSTKDMPFVTNERKVIAATVKTTHSNDISCHLSAPFVSATASCSFSSGSDIVTSAMHKSASILASSKSGVPTYCTQTSGSVTVAAGSNIPSSCVESINSNPKGSQLNIAVSNYINSSSSSLANKSSIITTFDNKSPSETKIGESINISFPNNSSSSITNGSVVITTVSSNSILVSTSRTSVKSTSSVVSVLPEQIPCASISSASSCEKPCASIFPPILSSGPAPSFSPLQCLPLSISDPVSSSSFPVSTLGADLNLAGDTNASVSQGQAKFGSMYPSSIVTTSGIQDRKMHALHSSNSMYSNLMLNTAPNFTFLCPTSTGLASSLRPALCGSSSLISSNSSIYSFSSSQNYSPNYATFVSLPLSHSTPTSFSFSLSSNPSSVVTSDAVNTYSITGHTHTGFGSSNNSENMNFPTFMASSDAHQNYPVQSYRYPIASSWDNCSSTESSNNNSFVPSSFVVSFADPCTSVQKNSKPLDSLSSNSIQGSTISSRNSGRLVPSSSTTDHFSDSLKAISKKPSGSTCSVNSSQKTTDTSSSDVLPPRAPTITSNVSQHSHVSTSLSSAGFFVPSSLHPVSSNKTKISSTLKEQLRDSPTCSSLEENAITTGTMSKSVLKENILPSGMPTNSNELKVALSTSSSTLQGIYPGKEVNTGSSVSCSDVGKNRDSSKVATNPLSSHNFPLSSSIGKSSEACHFSHIKNNSENKVKGTYPSPTESFNTTTPLTVSVSTAVSLSEVSYPTTDKGVNTTSTFQLPPLPFYTSSVDLSLENSNVSYYHPVSCSTSETLSASDPVSKSNSVSIQPSSLSTLGSDSLCFYPLSTPVATHQKMQTSDIISLGSTSLANVNTCRSPSTTSSTYGSIACMTGSRGTPWTPHSNSAATVAPESTKACSENSASIVVSRSDSCVASHAVTPMHVGCKSYDFSQSYLDYPTSSSSSGLQHGLCFTKPSGDAGSSRATTVQTVNTSSSSLNRSNDKLTIKSTEAKYNGGRISCSSNSKELKDTQSAEIMSAKADNKQISRASLVRFRPEANSFCNTNVSHPVIDSTHENPNISGTAPNSAECRNDRTADETVKHRSSFLDLKVVQNSTSLSASELNLSKQPGLQLFSPGDQSNKPEAHLNVSKRSYSDDVQQKNERSDLTIENSKICLVNAVYDKSVIVTESSKLCSTTKNLNELIAKSENSIPITTGQISRGELPAQVISVTNSSTEADTSTTASAGQKSMIEGNKSQDPVPLNSNHKLTLDRPIEEPSNNLSKQSTGDKILKTQAVSVSHDQNQVRPQQSVQLSQQMQTPVHASQNTNFQQNFLQQQQKSLLQHQSQIQKQSHDLEAQQLQQQHHMNLQLPGPAMQHHHPHHLQNTQQQTHQTHQHHQQHQHQHLMGSNLYSPSTFDYSGSIYNRRHPTSPRGDSRHCYGPPSYNKDQQLQHYQLDEHNPLNDLSGVSNYILEDGTDERETLADPVRYFSVSHLVSQSTTTRKQPTNSVAKSDEKKTEKGTKQVGGKKNESKSRGKTVNTSDSRRRSPARSQVSVQQAAMWHSSKQGAGQSKTPNYSAEALLSSQNYMRTAAVPPQAINQNYPIMTQNVYQYPHQMKNFSQNAAVPFGYSSATNNTVDACAPDYNFQLHQTAGPLGYAGNMPYMTPTYPYQTSSSSGMLPSDIMAASHPPPPPPPPYPRFHEFPPDQNSFPPNPSFPFAFDTQDMCGGSNGGVGNPQYTGTMLDNSTIIAGSSTTSTSHRSGPCVPFSPLRMMDRQQGAVVANMAPAAQLSSSLSNFNLTSIIPEIDNKVGGDNSSLLSTSRGGVATAAASSARPAGAPPADSTYALKLPQLDHAAANKAQFHANSMNNFFPTHPQVGFGLNAASLPLPTSSFSCLNFPPPDHS